ncbi:hypothetical protein B7463_g11912, partial [Scytalidium lignicola]
MPRTTVHIAGKGESYFSHEAIFSPSGHVFANIVSATGIGKELTQRRAGQPQLYSRGGTWLLHICAAGNLTPDLR